MNPKYPVYPIQIWRWSPQTTYLRLGRRSSVVMTISLFHVLKHVPNAHTGKFTPGSGTWEVAPRNPFFLVHSGGCEHTCVDYRWRLQECREVNSTRRHSGMDVDPLSRDNHSGPGRGSDHSQEPKRECGGKPHKSLKRRQAMRFSINRGSKKGALLPFTIWRKK